MLANHEGGYLNSFSNQVTTRQVILSYWSLDGRSLRSYSDGVFYPSHHTTVLVHISQYKKHRVGAQTCKVLQTEFMLTAPFVGIRHWLRASVSLCSERSWAHSNDINGMGCRCTSLFVLQEEVNLDKNIIFFSLSGFYWWQELDKKNPMNEINEKRLSILILQKRTNKAKIKSGPWRKTCKNY